MRIMTPTAWRPNWQLATKSPHTFPQLSLFFSDISPADAADHQQRTYRALQEQKIKHMS